MNLMLFQYTIAFPIQETYRNILLGLESVIVFFCFEFFILFVAKYLQRREKGQELTKHYQLNLRNVVDQFQEYLNSLKNREIAWGIVFFLLGSMYIMFIVADFFTFDMNVRRSFLYLGYLLFFFGLCPLSYSFEKNEMRTTNFFFTKCFFLFLITLFCSFFINSEVVTVITIVIWPFVIVMLYFYIRIMINRLKGLKKILIPVLCLLFGLVFLILGFALSIDVTITQFGLVSRFLGDIIQIAGVALLAISFYFLPSFSELDWLEKIRGLFIIHPSGISLYNYDFRPIADKNFESDLASGAIIAIKSLIEEMSIRGKKLESIEKEGFTILIAYGTYILSVLLTDEDSVSLREKNDAFCMEFEKEFPNLKHWYGNVDQFNSASKIVKKIFSID